MGKFLAVLYGVFAYLLFLVTAAYMVGFLGNFLVPKSIDAGAETPFLQAIIINLLLLSVFAVQHSLMARASFKAWIKSIIPAAIERSTYIYLSNFALLLLYWKWQPIKTIIWEVENAGLTMIIWGLFGLGWVIVLASTFMINHFELTGLQQIYDNWINRQPKASVFQINYLYKFVRHPLMLGFLIVFWATPTMTLGHLFFTLVMTVYIFISVKYLEEKDLRKAIGKEYEVYQEKVPMLIPFTKQKKSSTN